LATDRRSSSLRASLFSADLNQPAPLLNCMLTARRGEAHGGDEIVKASRILFIGNSFTNRNDLPGMLA
jgi:hypothetical protein